MKMTKDEIFQIAMKQSAVDLNCNPVDFVSGKNKVVISQASENARKYLQLPFFCDLVCYGDNIVASVDERVKVFVSEYIEQFPAEHCFQTPNLHLLTEEFRQYDMAPCFMAEYWLPDVDKLKELPCRYETKVLGQEDFKNLYTGQWSNALCENRKHLDILGVGAYDGEKLIGLAGCSADCDTMWQIGIDVLPEYRRQGIAAALTSRLALEILKRGKVPFYCCAWSNMRSAKNAVKSGFVPAWAEFTCVSNERIKKMLDK